MKSYRSFLVPLASAICLVAIQAGAVEKGTDSTFNTTAPAGSDILSWTSTTAWPSSGVTGWDYVGTVNGASGVYLGNDWVITAAHVGAGTFTLNENNYTVVPGSAQGITDSNGTADITLFQISTAPSLLSLSIATAAPTIGSHVAMLGYGGGQGETWGYNTVTQTNQLVQPQDTSFSSNDFDTVYGSGVINSYYLVSGDSGGGDFIFNSSTGTWQLAGINEAVDMTTHESYMVELSTYSAQIGAITGVPEPSAGLLAAGGALALLGRRSRKNASASVPCTLRR